MYVLSWKGHLQSDFHPRIILARRRGHITLILRILRNRRQVGWFPGDHFRAFAWGLHGAVVVFFGCHLSIGNWGNWSTMRIWSGKSDPVSYIFISRVERTVCVCYSNTKSTIRVLTCQKERQKCNRYCAVRRPQTDCYVTPSLNLTRSGLQVW